MRGKKKLSLAVALIFLMVSMLGTIVIAADSLQLRRLGGDDRYLTAIEISKEWKTSDYVILATGQNYADALAAAPLADALEAPILLTRNSWSDANMYIFDQILARIDELNPEKIFILGGSALISNQVEEALSDYEVERIFGENRYETSAKIADKIFEIKQSINKEAYITDGYDFKGALSVSAYAAQNGSPIYFGSIRSDKPELNKLDSTVKQSIIDLGIEKVTVVGDIATGVISDLEAIPVEVNSIPVDSLKIAKDNYTNPEGIVIARGDEYPDALCGGALAARLGYPMVLLPAGITEELPEDIEQYIVDNTSIEDARYLGGSGVISNGIYDKVEELILANYQENRYNEALENMIEGYVRDAEFGSSVTVNVSELGYIFYPAAAQYQLFEGENAITNKAALGAPVTVFPEVKAGDSVTVKVLDSNGAVLVTKAIVLKADIEDVIEAYVSAANFGSRVTIKLAAKGAADYPTAVSYQIYNNDEPVSSVANLDKSTTVFPKQIAGNSINVSLLDGNGNVIITRSVVLKGDTADVIKGYVSKADFGSRITVDIAVDGIADYPAATSYQLYEDNKAISSKALLGAAVTVVPERLDGDVVTVKLLDVNGAVLAEDEVVLEGNPEDAIVAYLNEAEFGSRVTVMAKENGSSDYPAAVSYQLYQNGSAVSSKAALGASVTIVPKAKIGDSYTVKLLDSNGNVVGSKDIQLIRPGADLFEGIKIGDVSEEPVEEPTVPEEEPTEPVEEPTEPVEEPTEPADEADEYKLTCKAASFGGNLNLSATVKGANDFPSAVKYRAYENGEPITTSAGTAIGANTTVFPMPAAGTNLSIELLDANGVVVTSFNLAVVIIN